ncbi:diguanylate cyclase domain-containing protein [Sideroxydans lithotrophicus]|uniref:Diguanylate cyclase with PAS/PAC sensor n=1 Tax=Sideroxydans lithotrophicus (strain ES-1) TaxID=580332 RepID=D5CTR9_SIDLE|nr:diguanylate cyclase [Sideroxydans lithotrophicus]ADE12231.1 diguanylate cyclase with PAS/PAC sensor [Sideroxydans lithotrophicus ES-1]
MQYIVKSAGLALAYLAAAKVGLVFGTLSSSATIFWPPGGIALAALLLGGLRYLPAVFVGAYLTTVMVDAPVIFAIGFSVGNTLKSYIGYFLLRRFGNADLALCRLRDLFILILLGALIPPVASAVLGTLSLWASDMVTPDIVPDAMWQWWRADVLGIAFVTPIILVFVNKKSSFFKVRGAWEMGALWAISFAVGQSVFLGWQPLGIMLNEELGLTWLFPLLIWAGLRTGRRNTGLLQLMFMSQVLAGAYLQKGYFSDDFTRYGMANFWLFAMLLAVAGMALAILATAQRKAMHQIALNAKVSEVSNDGIVIVDEDNYIQDINPAFTTLTGYTREDAIGRNPRFLSAGKQSHEFYADMWKSLLEVGHWEGEIWNRRKDGEIYLEKLSIYTLKDAQGKVVNRVGVFSDITQSRVEQETVAHHAQHDFLTGLPNRLLFRDRFNQQLALAKRYSKKFAVMYIDLDRFKPVNDTLGHQVGDLLLMAVADRLKSQVREIDTVSRFGGDEFAILVSEVVTQRDVTALAEKILAALKAPFVLENHTVNISGSLGIAIYPDDGMDMETILSNADTAMYKAKHKGANTYCR